MTTNRTHDDVVIENARNILLRAEYYRRGYETARDDFLARAKTDPAQSGIAWRGEQMAIAAAQYAQVANYDLLLPEDAMKAFARPEPTFSVAPAEIVARATQMVRDLASKLLAHSVGRATSTSPFHNAVDGATAEAYARIIRDFAHYCEPITITEAVYM